MFSPVCSLPHVDVSERLGLNAWRRPSLPTPACRRTLREPRRTGSASSPRWQRAWDSFPLLPFFSWLVSSALHPCAARAMGLRPAFSSVRVVSQPARSTPVCFSCAVTVLEGRDTQVSHIDDVTGTTGGEDVSFRFCMIIRKREERQPAAAGGCSYHELQPSPPQQQQERPPPFMTTNATRNAAQLLLPAPLLPALLAPLCRAYPRRGCLCATTTTPALWRRHDDTTITTAVLLSQCDATTYSPPLPPGAPACRRPRSAASSIGSPAPSR